MGKSPTINKIEDNFSKIKRRLGIKYDEDNTNKSNIKIVISLLYIGVTFLLLILYKPKVIYEDKPYDYDNKSKISYSKLFLYYLIIQVPLVLYITFF